MENDEKSRSTTDKTPNPTPACPQVMRKAKCKNADNQDLGPKEEFPIDNVPEDPIRYSKLLSWKDGRPT